MIVEYIVIEKVFFVEVFCYLWVVVGMLLCFLEGVRVGLLYSCYGVYIFWQEMLIVMGCIVGDGVINFDIVDVVVDLVYQGKGFGWLVMEKLVVWLDVNVFDGVYVMLVVDVLELYVKFGFESVCLESEGMVCVW